MRPVAVEGCTVDVSGPDIDNFSGIVVTSVPSLHVAVDGNGAYSGTLDGIVPSIALSGGFVAAGVAFSIMAGASYVLNDGAALLLEGDSVDVAITGTNPTTGATKGATATIKISKAGQATVEAE